MKECLTNGGNKLTGSHPTSDTMLHITVRLPVLLCAVKTVEGDFRFCWTTTPNVGHTHKENPNLVLDVQNRMLEVWRTPLILNFGVRRRFQDVIYAVRWLNGSPGLARTVMCRQDGRERFPVLLDDHSKCRTNSQRKSQLS